MPMILFLWCLQLSFQSVLEVCMICGRSMSLVLMAAKLQRIGMLWKEEPIDINITRGMCFGFKCQRWFGRGIVLIGQLI